MRNKFDQTRYLFLLLLSLAVLVSIPLTTLSTLNDGGSTNFNIKAAGGAELYLDPDDKNVFKGKEFSVQVRVDSGSEPINAVQANLTYNAGKLQFVKVSNTGSAFQIDAESTGGGGQVRLARALGGGQPTLTGDYLVTTVYFKVLWADTVTGISFAAGSAVVRSTDNSDILGPTSGGTYSLLSYWPGRDLARDVKLLDSSTSSTPKGHFIDAYGGIHPFGGVAKVKINAYWKDRDIARAIAMLPDDSGGIVLDAYGGLHPFGAITSISQKSPYWGRDIARDIVLLPSATALQPKGYVLDGYGGIHAFGGATVVPKGTYSYWSGRDIANALVLNSAGTGGYTMEAYGGIHNFGTAPAITKGTYSYWPGRDIARDIVLRTDSSGYTLDGYGGIHAFGGAPVIPKGSYDYWAGRDIANAATILPDGTGGLVLDAYGGLHPFGSVSGF